MDMLKYIFAYALQQVTEMRKKIGLCGLCEYAKSIDVNGEVECAKKNRFVVAKLYCAEFEIRKSLMKETLKEGESK